MVLIQTQFQRDILARHGSKGVSIDATHGVATDKKVKLVTLLVLDDCERDVPVAQFLTDHEDTVSIEIFLQNLYHQLAHLNISRLLSADAFYNVLKLVGGNCTKKILCIWYVIKDVNQKLGGHVGNFSGSRQAVCLFRAVMYDHTITRCQKLVVRLRTALLEFPTASKYINEWYLNLVPHWALVYRVGSRLTTSGHIESYHR